MSVPCPYLHKVPNYGPLLFYKFMKFVGLEPYLCNSCLNYGLLLLYKYLKFEGLEPDLCMKNYFCVLFQICLHQLSRNGCQTSSQSEYRTHRIKCNGQSVF